MEQKSQETGWLWDGLVTASHSAATHATATHSAATTTTHATATHSTTAHATGKGIQQFRVTGMLRRIVANLILQHHVVVLVLKILFIFVLQALFGSE